MSPARALLRLYPHAWRERYQDEVEALLDQHAVTLATLLDLLWGALDARLDPSYATEFTSERLFRPMSRLRTAMIVVFCAYAFFFLGVLGFSRLTDPQAPFNAAAAGHPAIAASFRVIVVAPQFGLLALLAGGLPIALDIIARAWRARNWRTLAFFATPPVLLAVCVAYLVLANTVWLTFNHQGYVVGTVGDDVVLTIAAVLLFGSGLASVVAVGYAVARSQISLAALRFARWMAALVSLAISVEIGAIAFWTAQTYIAARWLYDGACGAGCPGVADTNQINLASLGAVAAWMLVALVVAAVFTVRAFSTGGPEEPASGASGAPAVQPA